MTFKKGMKCKIVGNEAGHGFTKGTIVTLQSPHSDYSGTYWYATDDTSKWYVHIKDIIPLEPAEPVDKTKCTKCNAKELVTVDGIIECLACGVIWIADEDVILESGGISIAV